MIKVFKLPYNLKLYIHTNSEPFGDEPYRFLGLYVWQCKSTDKYSKQYPNRSKWDGYLEIDLFCHRLIVNLAKYPKWSKV